MNTRVKSLFLNRRTKEAIHFADSNPDLVLFDCHDNNDVCMRVYTVLAAETLRLLLISPKLLILSLYIYSNLRVFYSNHPATQWLLRFQNFNFLPIFVIPIGQFSFITNIPRRKEERRPPTPRWHLIQYNTTRDFVSIMYSW